MVVNGLIGTVLSELGWLLGCFDILIILFSIDQVGTWLAMVVNGLIGTVLSELLGLLGYFDTLLILFSINQVGTSGWQWW
jgi:hypothetical protein